MTLRFAGGASAQIVVAAAVNAGAVLVQATGSEAHLRELAEHAAGIGFAFNGAALWRGSEFVATPDEETFYERLGLSYIPPELREGQGEIAAAAARTLPRLLERSDMQGFLHCHTTYSDGSNSVMEPRRPVWPRDIGMSASPITARPPRTPEVFRPAISRVRPMKSTRSTPHSRASGSSRGSRPTSFRTDASTSTNRCSRGSTL